MAGVEGRDRCGRGRGGSQDLPAPHKVAVRGQILRRKVAAQ